MKRRQCRKIVSAAVLLPLSACATVSHEGARLPWAATNGFDFLNAVVEANNYQAAAGGLAMKKSPSPDVRAFGRMIWLDSLDSNSQLRWLANASATSDGSNPGPGIVLPYKVSTHYMFVIDELVPVSGEAFDQRFIAQQSDALKESLMLAQVFSRSGDDLELKEFAKRSVPKIQKQLDTITEIEMRHNAKG